jgi:hypothetical protein
LPSRRALEGAFIDQVRLGRVRAQGAGWPWRASLPVPMCDNPQQTLYATPPFFSGLDLRIDFRRSSCLVASTANKSSGSRSARSRRRNPHRCHQLGPVGSRSRRFRRPC